MRRSRPPRRRHRPSSAPPTASHAARRVGVPLEERIEVRAAHVDLPAPGEPDDGQCSEHAVHVHAAQPLNRADAAPIQKVRTMLRVYDAPPMGSPGRPPMPARSGRPNSSAADRSIWVHGCRSIERHRLSKPPDHLVAPAVLAMVREPTVRIPSDNVLAHLEHGRLPRLRRPRGWVRPSRAGRGAPGWPTADPRRADGEARREIAAVGRRHGARNLRVVGSVARGDAEPESDIDFLVDLDAGRSLLDVSGLVIDLEDLLGCRVHVVREAGARRREVRQRLLAEAVPLSAAATATC